MLIFGTKLIGGGGFRGRFWHETISFGLFWRSSIKVLAEN